MVNLPMLDGNVDYSQDFFGKEAFLTVSGQLNVECYAMALTRVYTFGPTFRAENSNTSRHLAEFWMIEPEIAFAGLKENADLAEDFLKYLFNALMNECEDDMAFFAARIDKQVTERLTSMIDSEFERMEYTDAIEILKSSKKSFEYPVTWGLDLQSEHERYLAEEHVGRPVILMNYPKEIKAFYMRRNDDERTVAAMDVLAPGIGELIGGSQREERLDYLDARLAELGISEELYWYRDLRRYGTAPHAGFGLTLNSIRTLRISVMKRMTKNCVWMRIYPGQIQPVKNEYQMNTTFTLVEIAIVLVVITLILAGVFKGQALIDSARVRSMETEVSGIRAAWYSFQDRYRSLPGDFPNARTHIDDAAVPGNGNGKIDDSGERAGVWQQLALAGFINGSFDGLESSAACERDFHWRQDTGIHPRATR